MVYFLLLLKLVSLVCPDDFWSCKEILALKKKGKLAAAHRSTILSLLPSGPGEFNRSWSYRAYPGQIYKLIDSDDIFLQKSQAPNFKSKVSSGLFLGILNLGLET